MKMTVSKDDTKTLSLCQLLSPLLAHTRKCCVCVKSVLFTIWTSILVGPWQKDDQAIRFNFGFYRRFALARCASLTIDCDDLGAAETAHKVCTVLRNLTISTWSQTSTLVRSPTRDRYHSTGEFHPAKCQGRPANYTPKIPKHTSSHNEHQNSQVQLEPPLLNKPQRAEVQCCAAQCTIWTTTLFSCRITFFVDHLYHNFFQDFGAILHLLDDFFENVSHHFVVLSSHPLKSSALISLVSPPFSSFEAADHGLQFFLRELWEVVTFAFATFASVHFFRFQSLLNNRTSGLHLFHSVL